MIRNNLIIAFRNFLRHPIYSAITVAGLVLGLACSIFILLWVMDEMSYDRYHADNDRVYKVMWSQNHVDQGITTDQWTSGLLAEQMRAEIPEIEATARVTWSALKLFKFEEKANYEPGDYADGTIFNVLNIKLIEGNPLNPLPDINSVAISRKMAIKYFNDQSALGKTFNIDNQWDATVTAVFEDVPQNATEQFEFIFPFEVYINENFRNFTNSAEYDGSGWQFTLVKLLGKADRRSAQSKLEAIFWKEKKASTSPPPPPFLHPMKEWHVYNNFVNGTPSGGRINYIVSFSLVAILILVISCINFMNLATARSMNRTREIGIKKVAGASRQVLIRQFLMESIVLSFLSMALALMLIHLLLPLFNSFTDKQITIDYLNPVLSGSLIGIALVTGLIAGSYPAFFLSSFRPASVLKGNLQAVYGGASIRKVLVVFQFSLSMVIIISALVVNEQIDFMRTINLGYDKSNVLTIEPNDELHHNYQAFRNELLQNPLIESVSRGDCDPMEVNGYDYYDWSGKSPDDDTYFNGAGCDYDYLETMRFRFLEGRNFSREFPSDSNAVIITQEAANRIGASNPIGEYVEAGGIKYQIIGVIEDFHNLGLKENMHPSIFTLEINSGDAKDHRIFVRYQEGTVLSSLEYTKDLYKKYCMGFPMHYSFIDREFEKQFRSELTTYSLATYFTIVAILISCLGLFGLASFSIERRTKEIGLRKVLGATITGLTVFLCKDFARLMVYAICIGCPIAYYVMGQYLNEYPYRTEMSLSTFLIPTLTLLAIYLGIISYQAIKAAIRNPVDALRTE